MMLRPAIGRSSAMSTGTRLLGEYQLGSRTSASKRLCTVSVHWPLRVLAGLALLGLCILLTLKAEPLLRYKTTYRPWYTKTIEWLPAHPHIFDLVYLNERGELCEGSRSNVYLRLDGDWYTPPVDSGCLPGVQRAELLDTGNVSERVLTLADLHAADEIRLSNALRGWFKVTLRET